MTRDLMDSLPWVVLECLMEILGWFIGLGLIRAMDQNPVSIWSMDGMTLHIDAYGEGSENVAP